jgi:hypothetical protein
MRFLAHWVIVFQRLTLMMEAQNIPPLLLADQQERWRTARSFEAQRNWPNNIPIGNNCPFILHYVGLCFTGDSAVVLFPAKRQYKGFIIL